MAKSLLESFHNKLAISEQVYKKAHEGNAMSNTRKVLVATCLRNMNNYLNENFGPVSGGATQRTDLGNYKKFCFNN